MSIKKRMKDRACALCGKIFTPGRWNAKYCLNCKVKVITEGTHKYRKKK